MYDVTDYSSEVTTTSSTKSAFKDIGEGIKEYQQYVKDFEDLAKKVTDPNIDPFQRHDYYAQLKSLIDSKDARYGLHTDLDNEDTALMQNKVGDLLSKIKIFTPIPKDRYIDDSGGTAYPYDPAGDDLVKEDGKLKSYSFKDGDTTYDCYLAILKDKDGNAVTAKDLMENWDNKDTNFTSKWIAPTNNQSYGKDIGWKGQSQSTSGCYTNNTLNDTAKVANNDKYTIPGNGIKIEETWDQKCADFNSSVIATVNAPNAAAYCVSILADKDSYNKNVNDMQSFFDQMLDC